MPIPKKIVVGTRASLLSVTQTQEVICFFQKEFPQYSFSLQKITTQGDRLNKWSQDSQGIFIKEIEEALMNKQIDLAVHSIKDLPTMIPASLKLAAVTKREDPRDVLISKTKTGFFSLKDKSIIGTSSLRRRAQLLRWHPDLQIKELRGNLDTRIKKLKHTDLDAIVVAAAGVLRLDHALGQANELFSGVFLDYLPVNILLPAAGQGALGIEIRTEESIIEDIAARINHQETYICISAERAFLKELGAGCRVPIGALAQIKNKDISLEVAVMSLDGRKIVCRQEQAGFSKVELLGRNLAQLLLKSGGREILKEAINDKG